MNQWVGNQSESINTAALGGNIASVCFQSLCKVDSPCWVESKDNMIVLRIQVCFLTFFFKGKFPMSHLTVIFPHGPQRQFWSPWLVCSLLIITDFSKLVYVSDASHKKSLSTYPTCYPARQYLFLCLFSCSNYK